MNRILGKDAGIGAGAGAGAGAGSSCSLVFFAGVCFEIGRRGCGRAITLREKRHYSYKTVSKTNETRV